MRKFDNINVIPFIDILLVLLAIVLTTATFISNGQLDINLPQASSTSAPEEVAKIEIAIDQQERLYFNGQSKTLEQIEVSLQSADPASRIRLQVDETVEFGQFVKLLDLLKKLSLHKVSIVTRKNS